LLDRQATKASLDLILDGVRGLDVWAARLVCRLERDFEPHAPTRAPGHVLAGVDQEPVEPGIEAVRIPQSAQVEPGVDQRVLDRILGSTIVANDEAGDGIEATDRRRRELREGVAIACSSPDDEVPIHLTT